MKAQSDEELFQSFAAGRDEALELLIRRHAENLYRFAYRFTSDPGSAEDIVQETFVQISQGADRFQFDKRFKPWLYAIAANKARDFLRRRVRRREIPIQGPKSAESNNSLGLAEVIRLEAADPSRPLSQTESRRIVRSIVERLPLPTWEIIQLAYFSHLPYREIAEVLGIPLGTVKSRLHAAVGLFGQMYREAVAESGDLKAAPCFSVRPARREV